jgi:hypothetical protein
MSNYDNIYSSSSNITNRNNISYGNVHDKFDLLKRKYELYHDNKEFTLSEEMLKENNIINTMDTLNSMINSKLAMIKIISSNIENLIIYKTTITEILTSIKDIESKYMKIYQQNSLNSLDIKLQEPLPIRPVLVKETLLAELRDQPIIEDIYEEMKRKSFIVNESYIHNMCDIIEKVNIKIIEETAIMSSCVDFVSTYKSIVNNCADKKISDKFKCTICFDNEVKICVTPCGHTFCEDCSKKLVQKCFVCNRIVKEKNKMFFLGKDEEEL